MVRWCAKSDPKSINNIDSGRCEAPPCVLGGSARNAPEGRIALPPSTQCGAELDESGVDVDSLCVGFDTTWVVVVRGGGAYEDGVII